MRKTYYKSNVITIVTVVLIAISITLIDFSDLSWDRNYRSYVGLFFGLLLGGYLLVKTGKDRYQ
jgi:uncharacterized membrane protein